MMDEQGADERYRPAPNIGQRLVIDQTAHFSCRVLASTCAQLKSSCGEPTQYTRLANRDHSTNSAHPRLSPRSGIVRTC